jgi:hypothetical protein
VRQGRSATFSTCGGSHDPCIVNGYIHKQLVEFDILLGVGSDHIVVLEPGDGKDGLTVQLGIVQAVEKVDTSGT